MHVYRQIILDEGVGGLGAEGLPTVSSRANACRPMHVQANVAAGGMGRLTRMQPHAHPYQRTRGPGMPGKRALGRHCRRHGVRDTLERHEEPVSRRIDLIPLPGLKRLAEQAPVRREDLGIPVTQVLEEACGGLDVAEQESDGAARWRWHTRCPPVGGRCPPTGCGVVCGQTEAVLTLRPGIIDPMGTGHKPCAAESAWL